MVWYCYRVPTEIVNARKICLCCAWDARDSCPMISLLMIEQGLVAVDVVGKCERFEILPMEHAEHVIIELVGMVRLDSDGNTNMFADAICRS